MAAPRSTRNERTTTYAGVVKADSSGVARIGYFFLFLRACRFFTRKFIVDYASRMSSNNMQGMHRLASPLGLREEANVSGS
jgi:hypothetical protein